MGLWTIRVGFVVPREHRPDPARRHTASEEEPQCGLVILDHYDTIDFGKDADTVTHGRDNVVQKIWFVATATIVALGCGDDRAPVHHPHDISRPARDFVETAVLDSDVALTRRVESRTTRESLTALLQSEAQRRWADRLDGGIKYADLFVELYGSTDWQLHFATEDGLTERGAAVVRNLRRARQQGLDPAPYHLARIDSLVDELARLSSLPDPDLELNGDEAELAVRWLDEQGLDGDDAATRTALFDALLDGLSPRIRDVGQRHGDRFSRRAERVAQLEARVADGFLRMARDVRHFNYRRLSWKELAERGGGKAVVYDRLEATWRKLITTDPDQVDDLADELRPPHPQYDRLVVALERYRDIRDAGGWEVVPRFDLAMGTRHPAVPSLRQRLATEGFDVGTSTDQVVDEPLMSAVHAYQETHQFRVGPPTPGFWRSLNVDIDRRIAQIEYTLQRWRGSYFRGESDFVFVNIPDFTAEIWADGERRKRLRVVVGNRNRVCDPETGEWNYPNATPIQWGYLAHMMLNPWWNVPSRIFDEEIAPKLDDHEWLQEHGYEVYSDGDTLKARQRPGDQNALGRVKFIFPNPHSTFLHDTPSKEYFDYPVRAFSHGCVRVQHPLELAEHFMTEYDHGGVERLDRIMELGSTIKIEFERKIPVFFEYYAVRVDDDGRVRFLADPYRIYRKELADDPSEVTSCTPTDDAPLEFDGTEATAEEQLDADGEVSDSPADLDDDLGP
jgi:murein L,D-transpeptidase YcbB/YkuD